MDSKRIIRLFDFLKHKEGRNIPFIVKLTHAPETLRPEELNLEHTLNLYNVTNITELPEGLRINGDLTLNKGIKKLPNSLYVNGRLYIYGSKIKEIPPTIQVRSLRIDNTAISSIPDSFTNLTGLSARNTKITKLPDNLKVKLLDITGTGIIELPKNSLEYAMVRADRTGLTNIPDNLKSSSISCFQCPSLKKIGDNVKLTRNFSISECKNLMIGKNLQIGGITEMVDVRINDFPLDINFGKNDVIITNSVINRLPDNLTINGMLNLFYTSLPKLPNNLHVKGELIIRGTKIYEIPYGLKVDGEFNISGTPLAKFSTLSIIQKINARGGTLLGHIIK